jgi:hypothetical protein
VGLKISTGELYGLLAERSFLYIFSELFTFFSVVKNTSGKAFLKENAIK